MDIAALARFLRGAKLPPHYRDDALRYFLPLANTLAKRTPRPAIVGISGAQGTGKSTLARLLADAANAAGRQAAVLSLDDFYLGIADRQDLAMRVHPLFATRGVPGTHDLPLLEATCRDLLAAGAGQVLKVPVFDKSRDDRAPEGRILSGPFDLILLEGWCVGIPAEGKVSLADPINALEREDDSDGRWRRSVNDALGADYRSFFAGLDALIWLRPPDFDAVLRWRKAQEARLAETANGERIMGDAALARFVAHFERLTRHAQRELANRADAILDFDADHRCRGLRYSGRWADLST